eukprot:CAMPEP_0206158534 /NCGR_PEP_ID=MMETSP1474-20131121/4937_1 /ASSEMBLY_ACC=CAM_ASM_001110 /TAXON_ID=97495 /ORGANISM="Imantonia sp., Strain RCC918" /LENGTH=352 /DNA_ID=CAMNT_0053558671 /DNA_START=59 /DNA_END=1117 /DNA_ORIENTATION=-
MTILTKVSQALNSTSFILCFIGISLFFGWFIFLIALTVGILAGVLERKVWNKRLLSVPEGNAVLITGCSSGFGYRLATRLANQGTLVFAGVRKEEDGDNLKKGTLHPDNIHTLILDVTKEEHVLVAASTVDQVLTEKNMKLLALVNNAGYGVYGPTECVSSRKIKNMFEVNFYGVISMTQAFIPLLRKHYAKSPLNSRIINISSGSGRIVMPAVGSYCASKYAVEALSDALRMEMKPWGISVAIVEPGRFHTEFQEKAYTDLEIDGIGVIEDDIKNHYTTITRETNEKSAKLNRPPSVQCVEVMEDALLDTKPLARYLAGPDTQTGVPFLDFLNHNENLTDIILGGNYRKLN